MRLCVIGTSCAGKTMLAKRAAEKLGIKFVEQDRLFWRPGWVQAPPEDFRRDVLREIDCDSWTICGNYSRLENDVRTRATHIAWLNFPLHIVLFRWLKRTLGRMLTREECCNGNYESIKVAFFEKDSLLWWILRTHRGHKRRWAEMRQDPKFKHVEFVELVSPRQAEAWLDSLT